MTFGTGVLVLCLDDRGGMNVGSLIYRLNLTTHCHMGHEWACYPVRQSASHLCPQLDSLQSAATQWGHFSGLPAGHEFHFTIQDSKDLQVFASNTLGLLIVGNYVLVWVRFESWFYLLIKHYGNATNKQLKKNKRGHVLYIYIFMIGLSIRGCICTRKPWRFLFVLCLQSFSLSQCPDLVDSEEWIMPLMLIKLISEASQHH